VVVENGWECEIYNNYILLELVYVVLVLGFFMGWDTGGGRFMVDGIGDWLEQIKAAVFISSWPLRTRYTNPNYVAHIAR